MSLTRKKVTDLLIIDYEAEARRIEATMREALRRNLHRRGLVVAISGGIDSSVCAALAVRAIGPKKVFGLILPETDSSHSSSTRGLELAQHLGIDYLEQNITSVLAAIGCYDARDKAIRSVLPDYDRGWKNKIVISGGLDGRVNYFNLIAQDPNGSTYEERLPLNAYLEIVAATNFKQRIRKTLEYFHADRLNYAVVGTPNYLEYDQGFFVKNGDGSADIKPIAHLFKTQVYAMARYLELPNDICNAEPTTDTYSLPQGQDEFYFALPYHLMDLALYCQKTGATAEELATLMEIDINQAERIYADLNTKRNTTKYLHLPPIRMESI